MKMDEAAKKIGKVLGEFKDKKLKSSSGQKVKSRDQAIAMSEANMPKRGQRTAKNRSKK
jgi:Sec-independent protein translocase protein TatA